MSESSKFQGSWNTESQIKFTDSGILTVSQVKGLKFKNPEVLMDESLKFL